MPGAVVAEVARWGAPTCLEVGISCLMSAVRDVLRLLSLAHLLLLLLLLLFLFLFFCFFVFCFLLFFFVVVVFMLLFFSKVLGLGKLTKLNTEMRICRTKFGIITHIFEPLGRYPC